MLQRAGKRVAGKFSCAFRFSVIPLLGEERGREADVRVQGGIPF